MATNVHEYVTHLKEIFEACDKVGDGCIGFQELEDLCEQLMIGDKYKLLASQLITKQQPRISFEQFKEGFVTVLAETPDLFEDPEQQEKQGQLMEEVSPKLTQNGKRYGRKSKPGESPTMIEQTEHTKAGMDESDFLQTLEVSQADHLRNIWKDLGVGESGSLNLSELSLVCAHIGMEQMNEEELQQLFDKLDSDHDSKISFDEFLAGLSLHGTPVNNSPSRMTPSDRLSAQLRKVQLYDDHVHSTSGHSSGIFSVLDKSGNGIVIGEEIVEFWKQIGLNPASLKQLLAKLDYRLDSEVKLNDLTFKLNDITLEKFGSDALFQALLHSYQCEVKHLRNSLESYAHHQVELETALSGLNVRNSMLVQEMEEMQNTLENSFEAKTVEIEKSFAEKQQSLQKAFESERDQWRSERLNQSEKASESTEQLLLENRSLAEKLDISSKQGEHLQSELLTTAEKLVSLEKVNFKLQQDLEQALIDRQQFEARDVNKELVMQEQMRMSNQKIVSLENDNRMLRDKSDELLVQLEMFSEQGFIGANRRPARRRSTGGSRHGSVLSKYAKPAVPLHREPSPSDDEERPSSRKSIVDSVDSTLNQLRVKHADEMASLKHQLEEEGKRHSDELTSLKAELEERRALGKDAFDQELAAEKEKMDKQLEAARLELEMEKEQLTSDYEQVQDKLLTEVRNTLKVQHEDELNKVKAVYSQQLVELQNTGHVIEAPLDVSLREKGCMMTVETCDAACAPLEDIEMPPGNHMRSDRDIAEEYRRKLDVERDALIQQYETEKSELIRNYQIEMADLRHQIETLRASGENDSKAPPVDVLSRLEDEKVELMEKHQLQIAQFEHMLSLGEAGLSGKLRDDFDKMLQLQKSSWTSDEIDRLLASQQQMENNHEDHVTHLKAQFEQERRDIEVGYESHIQSLMERFEKEMEESEEEVKNDLEKHFLEELARIKKVHSQEMDSANNSYRLLNDQLSKLQKQYQGEMGTERTLSRLEEDAALQQSIDELTDQNSELLELKTKADTELEACQFELRLARNEIESAKEDYELRISHFTTDLDARQPRAEPSWEEASVRQESQRLAQENEKLQTQLKASEEKCLDLTARLTVADSQRQRSLQQMDEKMAGLVEQSAYENLQTQLNSEKARLEAFQKSNRELNLEQEQEFESKLAETERKMRELVEEKEDSLRKMGVLRASYNELLTKYKQQMEKTVRAGFLCKDLYIENSQLMGAVQITEEREKDSHKQAFSLEERNRAIHVLLSRVCQAATFDDNE